MILTKEQRDIQQNIPIDIEKKSFTITANAHAFKILSDTLYSNKIKSIIRELSTNAVDSHIWANKEKVPFKVTLPTKIQPIFAVEDFGVGMSHEDVMNTYNSYFFSNKTNSNDVTGAFGLGSKSPFAYTEIFNVTSIFNHIKREYQVFFNEQGVPDIICIHKETTNAENGVKVFFTVQEKDFHNFQIYAEEVYSFFDIKPISNIPLKYKIFDIIVKRKDFFIFKTSLKKQFIIQGNVSYPFNLYDIQNNLNKKVFNFFINKNIALKFNIGEIEVTPSRESLSYNNKTITNIVNKLNLIYKNIHSIIVLDIKKAKTFKQAQEILMYYMENNFPINNNIYYKNQLVYYNYEYDFRDFKIEKISKETKNKDILYSLSHKINNENIYVINSKKRGFKTAFKMFKDNNKNKNIYLFHKKNDLASNKEVENFIKKIYAGNQLINTEKILNDYTIERKKYNNHSILKDKNGKYEILLNNRKNETKFIDLNINDSDTKYYIHLHHNEIFVDFSSYGKDNLYNDFIICSKFLNIEMPSRIFVVRSKNIKKIKKDKSYINIIQYYQNEIKKFFQKNKCVRIYGYVNHHLLSFLESHYYFKSYVNKFNQALKEKEKFDNYLTFYNSQRFILKLEELNINFQNSYIIEETEKKLFENYPLLKLIEYKDLIDNQKKILKYIKVKNEENKKKNNKI